MWPLAAVRGQRDTPGLAARGCSRGWFSWRLVFLTGISEHLRPAVLGGVFSKRNRDGIE